MKTRFKELFLADKGRVLKFSYTVVLPCLFLVSAFLLSAKPLVDADLWWHLKTGERILQERALPSDDPFSYTTPKPLSDGQIRGMRSQWLGQVLFYLVQYIGGLPGLSFFRAGLIVLPFVLMYLYYVRKGLHPLQVLSVVSLPLLLIIVSRAYTFERPQAFSFILSVCLVAVLSALRRPGAKLFWTGMLCLLMAMWANLHGGFIFGIAIVGAFGAAVLLEAVVYREREGLRALPALGLGVFFALLNPNSYHIPYGYFKGMLSRISPPAERLPSVPPDISGTIMEWLSLWEAYRKFRYFEPLFIFACMALGAVILVAVYVRKRRVDFPELFMYALFIALGVYYTRGATFFLVVFPLIVLSAQRGMRGVWRAGTATAFFGLSLALVLVTMNTRPWMLKTSFYQGWLDSSYPAAAVEFITKNRIQGPMFNDMRWGGYLIWRLYPDYKVFLDGRLMSREVILSYLGIHGARGPWKMTLDVYGVNFVLVEVVNRQVGLTTPLILEFLAERPEEWKLVYVGDNAALFLRDRGDNRRVIRTYNLPLEILYGTIYEFSGVVLGRSPGNPNAMLSRAIALYGLGRKDEAVSIMRRLPSSPLRDKYLKRYAG